MFSDNNVTVYEPPAIYVFDGFSKPDELPSPKVQLQYVAFVDPFVKSTVGQFVVSHIAMSATGIIIPVMMIVSNAVQLFESVLDSQ